MSPLVPHRRAEPTSLPPARRARQALGSHPALALGLLGGAIMLAWVAADPPLRAQPAFRWLFSGALLLLRPFAIVATLIDPALRRAPGWVDTTVTLVLGLAPYLAADALLRRLRRRPTPSPPMTRLLPLLLLLPLSVPATAQGAAIVTSDHERCARLVNQPARWPDLRTRFQSQAAGGDGAAAFARGCLAMADARWDDARAAFELATERAPRVASYHFWLGRAFGEQAQSANVIRQASLARKTRLSFERAVALDPDFLDGRQGLVEFHLRAPAIVGGSVARARTEIEEIRRRDPYRGGHAAARFALARKEPAAAIAEYRRLVEQYPDSAWPYYSLALAHLAAREPDDAVRAADRLIAARPDAPLGHYALGRVAMETGLHLERGARALERYVAAPAHRPDDPPPANAHWRLGAIHERRGAIAEARAAYEQALRLDPSLDAARKALARLR